MVGSRSATRALYNIIFAGTRRYHVQASKFGGVDSETFKRLTVSLTPLIRDFYKPFVTSLEVGRLSMSLPFRQDFIGNPAPPCLHGGVVATLFDHVGGFCAWSALDSPTKRVSTIDLRVDYLLPAPCEELHFDAVLVSQSKKLLRVDVECWDNARKKKLAIGRCLFNIYDKQVDLNTFLADVAAKDNKG